MFIAALFKIARIWKQPKCPLIKKNIFKCIKNDVVCIYIYIYIYNSVIKRNENETGSFVVMWMNLESVIQNEVSEKEKNNIVY